MAGMERLPDALVVVDLNTEALGVKEARRLHIPVIGLTDTNADPDHADYVVPGNDDAIRSCALFLKTIAGAISDARQMVTPEQFATEQEEAAAETEAAPEAAPEAETATETVGAGA